MKVTGQYCFRTKTQKRYNKKNTQKGRTFAVIDSNSVQEQFKKIRPEIKKFTNNFNKWLQSQNSIRCGFMGDCEEAHLVYMCNTIKAIEKKHRDLSHLGKNHSKTKNLFTHQTITQLERERERERESLKNTLTLKSNKTSVKKS